MKIRLHNGARAIERWDPADVRPDAAPSQIQRANHQIAQFARVKDQIRGVLELNDKMGRSYDAAVTTNWNRDFRGTFTSANSEVLSSDYTVRARARTVAKDTPQGKAVIRTFQNNVVGYNPFKLDMRLGAWKKQRQPDSGQLVDTFVEEVEVNRAVEAEWEIFGQGENYTIKRDMCRMEAWRIMEASAIRDGYVLQRHRRGFPGNPYRYAVELLECDRLQSSFMGLAEGTGNPIRFSIEYDKQWNYPVAVWLLTRHPGDVFGQSTMAGNVGPGGSQKFFRERVAIEDMLIFNNLRDRAEQDVGFTELDACVQSLWRLFQYEKALTYAAIASCMKVYWIKKTLPTGMTFTSDEIAAFINQLAAGVSPTQNAPATGGATSDAVARQQKISQRASVEVPGSTLDLDYGFELMQTDPKFPIEAAHEFRQDNLRDIAVAAGVSYQDVSGDFQNLGFAAALMCQTPKQEYCRIRQHNFIDRVVRPTFRVWMNSAIMSGRFDDKYPELEISILRVEDYVQAARFKGKRWAFVNPLVQAQTLIILMEAGVMSPQQVQDELPDGVSIEQLYTLFAEAKSEADKHGLDFSNADVTRPTISKGEPGQTKPTPQSTETGGPAAPAPAQRPANPVRSSQSFVRSLDDWDGLLWVIQHGETALNVQKMVRSWQNPPLNDKGKQEAEAAGDTLAGRGITMIVTSDLKRAHQTAAIISGKITAGIVVDRGLRPWGFGPEIEGKKSLEVSPQIKHLAENPDERPPGTYEDGTLPETFNEYRTRIYGTIEKILEAYPTEQTAIISHYRTLKMLEARLPGNEVDLKKFLEYKPETDLPGEVCILENGALSHTLPAKDDNQPARHRPQHGTRAIRPRQARRVRVDPAILSLIQQQGDGLPHNGK